jgi:hypothetical protein
MASAFNKEAGAPVLRCERPIEYEYRGGTFYINDPALGFVRTMEAESFFQSIANAVECSRGHRPWEERPTAKIISFADHAATSGRPSK